MTELHAADSDDDLLLADSVERAPHDGRFAHANWPVY